MITCHNRRDITLRCLERLFTQELPEGAAFTAFLVDDGSTDGTGTAVCANFPTVRVIEGDGSLYWNQGMRLAWKIAAAADDWNAYLWLNDDTMLLPGALKIMFETLDAQFDREGQRGIVAGSCRGPIVSDESIFIPQYFPLQGVLTYGGRTEKGLITPTANPQPIKAFNGNLVLISRNVFERVGNLNSAYRHSYGDIDYGIRANTKRIPIWLAPGFLGECPKNPPSKWLDAQVPLLERWKNFRGVKGVCIYETKAFQKTQGRGNWLFTYLNQLSFMLMPKLRSKIDAKFRGK